ncbi:MAG TPA: hypothetical protein VF897_18250 [Roseiflexaceae bacterium]
MSRRLFTLGRSATLRIILCMALLVPAAMARAGALDHEQIGAC